MTDALYHFTCPHGAEQIRQSGELRPFHHPMLGASLVWLTDIPWPDRYALGLTSSWINCDRTAVRVLVPAADGIVRWPVWALRHHVPDELLGTLEAGACPDRWWVCAAPLPVAAIRERTARHGNHPSGRK